MYLYDFIFKKDSIGECVYKCELCKALFTSSQLLSDHYHSNHKVTLCFMQPQGKLGIYFASSVMTDQLTVLYNISNE